MKEWPEGVDGWVSEWSPVLISNDDPSVWWPFGVYTAYGDRETADQMLEVAIRDQPEGYFESHPDMHIGLAVRRYTPWRLV